MNINNWIVLECPKCKHKNYFYGNIEELIEDDINICYKCNMKQNIIKKEYYSSKDYAEILSYILEDNNKYKLMDLPISILNSLDKYNLDENIKKEIILNLYEFFNIKF